MGYEFQTNELPLAEVDELLAEVDPSLFELIPMEVCHRLGVVPLTRKGNALVVGFYEKLSTLAAYELKLLTGLRVVSLKIQPCSGRSMPSFSGSQDSGPPRISTKRSLLKPRRMPPPSTRPSAFS
ncbi:hypothetical protein JST97_06075 [bacterium]|nr:hypothetical protein [bacterium]